MIAETVRGILGASLIVGFAFGPIGIAYYLPGIVARAVLCAWMGE